MMSLKELDTLQNKKNKLLPMQTLLNKLNTDPYYKVFRINNSDKTNLKKQFLVFANKLGKFDLKI